MRRALIFLFLSIPLFANDLPLDPAVIRGELANGFTYYIRQNAKPEQRVELRLAVKAGSLQETDEQRGLAHFLEHMAFNGTANFEKQALVDYIQKIGMRFGPDLNAYTSFAETVYQLQVPTDDPEILEKAFLIMSDWAHQISLETEEIDKERGVVIEEWRGRRGAGARIADKQIPILYKGSRYPDRLPIGDLDVLRTAPREQFQAFYETWYRPHNMAIIVVGDLEPDKVKALIEKHLGPIPADETPTKPEKYPVPDHQETLFSIDTDPETTSSSISVVYKHPPTQTRSKDDLRRSFARQLYLGMLNQRLYERTQEAEPPYVYGFTQFGNFTETKASFRQTAMVKEGAFEEGLLALLTEAKRVTQFGFTQAELDRQRIDILRGLDRLYQERDKNDSSSYVGSLVNHFLSGTPTSGIEWMRDFCNEVLPQITLEEIKAAADGWVTDANRVILVTAPEKEGLVLPTEEQLIAILKKGDAVEVEAYKDEVSDDPLVPNPPKGGSVVARKRYEAIDTTVWTLSNGARVVLKPTDFKNDQISFAGFSPGGNSLAADADYIPANTASSIVSASGVGAFSAVELDKKLTGKIAQAGVSIGELSESVRGGASPQDIETMFQLVYLRFTAPRISEDIFNSIKTRYREFVKNAEANPNRVFSDAVTQKLYGDHPRRQAFTMETLEKMDADASLAFYKDRFADASDFTFIIVGNFTLEEMEPKVAKWLGGLPTVERKESWRDLNIRIAKGPKEVIVRKGLEPKASVQLLYHGDAEWTPKQRLVISMLGQVLNNRMREILREDMGGVYGVNVYGAINKRPVPSYTTAVSFTCDPERVDELFTAVQTELKRATQEGFEAQYLEKVQESMLRSHETSVKRNGFWISYLVSTFNFDQEPERIMQYEDRVKAVTTDDLKVAANRYFLGEDYLKAILYPAETSTETEGGE